MTSLISPLLIFLPDSALSLVGSSPFRRSRVTSSCSSSTCRRSNAASPPASSPVSRDNERLRRGPGAEPEEGVKTGSDRNSSRMESWRITAAWGRSQRVTSCFLLCQTINHLLHRHTQNKKHSVLSPAERADACSDWPTADGFPVKRCLMLIPELYNLRCYQPKNHQQEVFVTSFWERSCSWLPFLSWEGKKHTAMKIRKKTVTVNSLHFLNHLTSTGEEYEIFPENEINVNISEWVRLTEESFLMLSTLKHNF